MMHHVKYLLSLSALLLFMPAAYAQFENVPGAVAAPAAVNPEIKRIQAEAQTHFQAAFRDIDQAEYLKTANLLEGLIKDYGADPYVQDAYFDLAEIYHSRLRQESYRPEAIRVLKKFLEVFPYSDKCLDAQLRIAVIYYRDLYELDNAVDALETYFDMLPLYQYLESEKLQGQLLLAKCYQRQGNFGQEKRVWDGIILSNPAADRTGRYKFLNNIAEWKRLPGEGIVLYFHTDVSQTDYQRVFTRAEDEIAGLEETFGATLPCPVALYLYDTPEQMSEYTSLETPLVIEADREIHLAVDQADEMPWLMAGAYAGALNSRPMSERHPLVKGGFGKAYYVDPAGVDIHYSASRLLMLFDKPPTSGLFTSESAFFGSAEYDRLAGSFCAYLIKNEPAEAFAKLYQGLYPRHDADTVENAFLKFYGKSMDTLISDWYQFLSPYMAKVKADRSEAAYDLSPVKIDLSSPRATLDTWYEALRKGDFDAFIGASVSQLSKLFKEARDAYEDEGIFNQVVIEEFVYPYYDTTFNVIQESPVGEEIYLFKIEIIKDGDVIEEKNVPLRKIGGKWYVDTEV